MAPKKPVKEKNIVVFVQKIPPGVISSIKEYAKREKTKLRIMILHSGSPEISEEDMKEVDFEVKTDFTKPDKITESLIPYYDELYAITSRSESHMSKFAAIIPHVPYLKTPSATTLGWSTDKLMMRKRLRMFDPKHTPKFAEVKANTVKERKRIADTVGFPMIIKPANLSLSQLVSICYHEEELKQLLGTMNRKINKLYRDNKRTETPKIIAEEYMEGDIYSIDSYVNSRGVVYHCPMVKVVTGKNIGHDDFFNYMHMTPTTLKKESVENAQARAESAIHALGLRSTTAHTELMKIDDEWKIIEVGPRIGGFRDKLHRLSCGFSHTMNDILIRVGKKPEVPKKCEGYAATLKWYPTEEGKITELKGIMKIRDLKSFVDITVNKKVGDKVLFAKHGGKAVFSVTLHNKERSKLLADIRRIEQSVFVGVK